MERLIKGRVIVIEGTDSSGKETQTDLLYKRLLKEFHKVRKISFPNYKSRASEPVKMYLEGEFGTDAQKLNPYPISTMYAIDRYASFKTEWETFYNFGGILITDRYTTSNMVHQASKIENQKEKQNYLDWLEDFEYNKMEIPKPDIVIFLKMPTEIATKLMAKRDENLNIKNKKDIHEKNKEYLEKSYQNACQISKIKSWIEIECVDNGKLKTIENISNEIFEVVSTVLKQEDRWI